jgi:nitrogen regulatory protein P-II 1
MKNLTLIVHTDVEKALADTLRGQKSVQGFTFTHVEGHGVQGSMDVSLSTRDLVVGYTPRVRVDIILEDKDVDAVLESLARSGAGLAGRCV